MCASQNHMQLTLVVNKLCKRHSNAFDRSVDNTPLTLCLSKHCHHFFTITEKQCCALYPLVKPTLIF